MDPIEALKPIRARMSVIETRAQTIIVRMSIEAAIFAGACLLLIFISMNYQDSI